MENDCFNMDRRNFLKTSSLLSGALLLPQSLFASQNDKFHFIMPPKPFEYYIKEAKQKGGRILLIGGIHGNEEGGYKASDILINTKLKKGTLAILPRSNPESIFTDMRGYNGDMNRKFAHLSKQDKDFYKINSIKNFIADFKPDVVLSLHDGYGFFAKHHNQWGECIVIDETHYNNIDLYNPAKYVSDFLKKSGFHIPINNTHTFKKQTHHKEQRKSLTYYTLQEHNIPAFCIEGSKQTSLYRKVKIHLLALQQFFKLYNVEIEPSFEYLISNINKLTKPKSTHIIAYINNQKKLITHHDIIKVPKGSEIKFEIANNRAGGLIAHGVNVNYKSFHYKHNLTFYVKNDKQTEYRFNIIKG